LNDTSELLTKASIPSCCIFAGCKRRKVLG